MRNVMEIINRLLISTDLRLIIKFQFPRQIYSTRR